MKKAFTLIELLIVVAIIAILAAIAVPNFLEAQVRAKVSRTKADMRTVTTAIESYFVDNNKYPSIAIDPAPFSIPAGPQTSSDPCVGQSVGLSTPISYISAIPTDPFGKVFPDDLYTFGGATTIADGYYYSTKAWYDCRNFGWGVSNTNGGNNALWVLQSKGPDKYFASPNSGIGTSELNDPYRYLYDSSNGTVSTGNIARSGP